MSDLLQDVLAMVKHLEFAEKEQVAIALNLTPEYCPYDCDSCHDEDCPCDRLGCAGYKEQDPGARCER